MNPITKTCIRLAALAALSTAAPSAIAAASPPPPVPQGILPDAATPLAYRLDLVVQPEQDRFSGHVEIDVTLKAPTSTVYRHGRDLHVASVKVRGGAIQTTATYTQVDPLGVARLDFAKPLPAGNMFVKDNGIFTASSLPALGAGYCSVEKAAMIETALRPKVDLYQQGGLSLDRTVEQVHDCGVLKQARGADAVAALTAK